MDRIRSSDDLTTEDREQLQLVCLKRWLALRFPKGTRRRTDQPVPGSRVERARGA